MYRLPTRYGVLTWKITDPSLRYFTNKVYRNNSAIKLFRYSNERSKTRLHTQNATKRIRYLIHHEWNEWAEPPEDVKHNVLGLEFFFIILWIIDIVRVRYLRFWKTYRNARRLLNSPGIAFLNEYPPVVLCYVVGSRQLMPPDALQPKAYCTNPGL